VQIFFTLSHKSGENVDTYRPNMMAIREGACTAPKDHGRKKFNVQCKLTTEGVSARGRIGLKREGRRRQWCFVI
jgi:hypothetical protein